MNNLFEEDLINSINNIPNIEKIKNKTVFISGSNGLIGKFMIDMFMYLNQKKDYKIKIIANTRSIEKLKNNFKNYLTSLYFKYYIGDVNNNIDCDEHIDYIINCASNTHPKAYATDPIGTIMTNINGTKNILELACKTNAKKVIYLSSVEIYGENINNIGKFKENQMGYINCNSLRAGYNESKRAGEALCQAYIENKNIDISIIRLPRIYGPTLKNDDSKALSQFIKNGLNGENIILKSEGNQFFSYLYVADAVTGILTVLLNGKCGEAYNVANEKSDIRLKDLAKIISEYSKTKVVFDLPSNIEKKGFSTANDARLDYSKITNELHWKPIYSIEEGIKHTLYIMKK